MAALVLIGAAEALLRALDIGAERGLFAEFVRPDGVRVQYMSWNPQRNIPMEREPQREFLSDKPPGAIRIFVVGESSAEGVPYRPSHSFSGWLAKRLAAQAPDVRWEVVNAAVAGATSESMLTTVRDIATHEPDLLVVYLGHNEVGGHLTAAERARFGPHRIRLRSWLGSLRLYRLAARRLPKGAARLDPTVPIGTPRNFASDADLRAYSLLYRRRVEEMVDLMHGVGARTALLTLAQNYSDWEPVVSVHRDGLSAAELAEWQRACAEGDAVAARDCAAAVAAWERALAIDGTFAALHFRLAECYRILGRLEQAAAAYRRASDFDRFTQGAYSPFNAILGEIAASRDAWLVDTAGALARASGDHLVGFDLFVDAMHPNLRGHQMIAAAVAERLREEGVPIAASRWRLDGYDDPDPETVLRAEAELRIREQVALAMSCYAAGRPCARQGIDAAARGTTSEILRRNLLRLLGQTTPTP